MKNESRHAPTIKEIAALAGVSKATVSYVLQGKKHFFTPQTEQKVKEIIRQVGYRPNHIARSLAKRKCNTLGIVTNRVRGPLVRNHYFNMVLDGFLDYASHRKYHTKIICLSLEDPREAIEQLQDCSIDGVVVSHSELTGPFGEWIKNCPMPVVNVGSFHQGNLMSCVGVDDFKSEYETTKWLISHGHRRIGYFCTSYLSEKRWARDRREGYLKALEDSGIVPEPGWYQKGVFEDMLPQVTQFVSPLTAIVFANDWMAMQMLELLHSKGVRVPEDVSLVGFDDIDLIRLTQPPLTSISQPLANIGAKAAEILIDEIESGEKIPTEVRFPGTLVERASVKSLVR